VLANVDDPRLAKMIEKHAADEDRHEQQFRECATRAGAPSLPVPDELKLLMRLDKAAGNLMSKPIEGDRGVMEAYVMLQVIEERAITQFKVFEQAFREIDPATADTFAVVRRDEERHLKYCHAIAKQYSPDEETRVATLARFRKLERKAFAENSRANMRYSMARGYWKGGGVEKFVWRLVADILVSLGGPESDPAIDERKQKRALPEPVATAA
jgi:rubrerythrin